MMMTIVLYPVAATAGAITHLLYFNRGEHHMYGVRYLQAYTFLVISTVLVTTKSYEQPLSISLMLIGPAFLSGLLTSLLTYRLFFSPLNKFPGPYLSRISNLWLSFGVVGKSSQLHIKIQDIHAKYGDFVRIGSNDLSIIDPKAVQIVYGQGSKCRKSSWYDQDSPLNSMHTTRSRKVHALRRRVWSPAFSDKAIRGYEKRIQPYVDELARKIEGFDGGAVNVADWFNFFGYDVMGDVAFGKGFGMIEGGEDHFAIGLLKEAMQPMSLLLPPWFFRVLVAMPGAGANYWKFVKYCSQTLEARMNTKPHDPDILSTLLTPYAQSPPTGLELLHLQADTRLIIVAGSDTTSATLVYIFYHLVRNPSVISKLRKEIEAILLPDGGIDHRGAQHTDWTNGVINEALRLHPPVPSAVQRMTPPEGLMIGETFVPGDVNVWCPQYVIGRSDKAYVDPNSFVPERWFSRPEMIKDKTCFAPFSIGPMGCIGKPLALMELRAVLAKLIMTFDVEFAPGEDGTKLIEKGRDHFTMETGPLNLVFKKREV